MELISLYFSEQAFRWIVFASISGVGLTLIFLISTLMKEIFSKNFGDGLKGGDMNDLDFIKMTVELARNNVVQGGQPFGAVLVHDGHILADGVNETYKDHDPTAHAEIQAIRNASKQHAKTLFPGTTMYASGKPCAMCMAAMIQAGVSRLVYCAGDDVGEEYGWSTEYLYLRMQNEFGKQGVETVHIHLDDKKEIFESWKDKYGLGNNKHMNI